MVNAPCFFSAPLHLLIQKLRCNKEGGYVQQIGTEEECGQICLTQPICLQIQIQMRTYENTNTGGHVQRHSNRRGVCSNVSGSTPLQQLYLFWGTTSIQVI